MVHDVHRSDQPDVFGRDRTPIPAPGTNWAHVKYFQHEAVEGRAQDGSWIKCNVRGTGVDFSHFHLNCTGPQTFGQEKFLPNVPYTQIRRVLDYGDNDYLVDNRGLMHKGKGLRYRFSQNYPDVGGEYVPWGSVIVGEDAGDWVRTDRGYFLPKQIYNHTVLTLLSRSDAAYQPHELAGASFADMLGKQKLRDDHAFAVAEHVLYKTKRGEWIKARITQHEEGGTYGIVAMPIEFAMYPVDSVAPENLKHTELKKHVPQKTESKLCKRDGCFSVLVNSSALAGARDFVVEVPRRSNLRLMMTMVCQKAMKEFRTCVNETRFSHNGKELEPDMRVEDTQLEDQSVVEMKTRVEIAAQAAAEAAQLKEVANMKRKREQDLHKKQAARAELARTERVAARNPKSVGLQKVVDKQRRSADLAIKHTPPVLTPAEKRRAAANLARKRAGEKPIPAPGKKKPAAAVKKAPAAATNLAQHRAGQQKAPAAAAAAKRAAPARPAQKHPGQQAAPVKPMQARAPQQTQKPKA